METLDAIVQRHPKPLSHSRGVSVCARASPPSAERSGSHSTEGAHAHARVAEELAPCASAWSAGPRARVIARWREMGCDASIARAARRGRRARKEHTSVALHQWRKRAKDLRYVAEMLEGRDKQRHRRLRRVAQLADRLGETLGEEHDLALLAEQVRSNRDCFKGEKPARKALERHIARRRSRLRARAWQLGERLYRRKPDRFVRRLLDH